MKLQILFLLTAFLLLSGCLQEIGDINRFPEIKQVLDANSNAVVESFFINKEAATIMIKDIREECGTNLKIEAYWNVAIKSGENKWEFYVSQADSKVVCTISPEDIPPDQKHECQNKNECNDNIASTKDECTGTPKKCLNTEITECINNDNYCPADCVYRNDNDCPAINTCATNEDCSDTNSFTKDLCQGTPKACVHELRTCEEMAGTKCEVFEACPGKELSVKGSEVCCEVKCEKTESCQGITCPSEQKCVRGNCIDKSCKERNSPLCNSSEICTENYYRDTFGITCCTGECKQPCTLNTDCEADYVCSGEFCIATSCGDVGKEVDVEIEICVGETVKTLDSNSCCLNAQLKTCKQREGIYCNPILGESCSKATIETFDIAECCLDTCDIEPCFGKVCAVNRKCNEEDGECILKECEELNGIVCEEGQTCNDVEYEASNTLACCVGSCE